jgi:putative DNA primase/helicase
MGLAVAGGTILLRWSTPKARRVLYVDGEVTLIDLQRRVAALKAGMGVDIRSDHLRLHAADYSDVPDLVTEAGQRALDPAARWSRPSIIVVDNISTLCRTGSDNDAGSRTSMQEWILRLRRRGIAVPPNSFGNQRVARDAAVGDPRPLAISAGSGPIE